MRKTVIYARETPSPPGKIEEQIAACRARCNAAKRQIVGIYVESAKSQSCPELWRAIDALESGHILVMDYGERIADVAGRYESVIHRVAAKGAQLEIINKTGTLGAPVLLFGRMMAVPRDRRNPRMPKELRGLKWEQREPLILQRIYDLYDLGYSALRVFRVMREEGYKTKTNKPIYYLMVVRALKRRKKKAAEQMQNISISS